MPLGFSPEQTARLGFLVLARKLKHLLAACKVGVPSAFHTGQELPIFIVRQQLLVGAHAGFELLARVGGFAFGLGLFLGNLGADVAVLFQAIVGGKKTHACRGTHGGHPVALDVLGGLVDGTELEDGEAAHGPSERQDHQE